ncbi:MAG: GGDEF domain-containing protein [Candidatus Omnitrophica bacterium]|nr:GGDEF domain-containing protein [Candidatus Omnitrophota bacterium]
MTKKVVSFCAFALFLFLAHHFGGSEPVSYFAFLSLASIFILSFALDRDYLSFFSVLTLGVLSILWQTVAFKTFWALGFLLTTCVLSAVGIFYLSQWDSILARSAERKLATAAEALALRQKLGDKEGSLNLMSRQLAEIINLYDLAKELNDCLGYEQLVEELRERVFRDLAFKRAILLVFAGEADPPSVVRRFTILESGGIEDSQMKSDLSALEKKAILTVYEKKEIILFRESSELDNSWFADETIDFPLAIFPLVVQDRVIAVFLVQGGSEDDLPKFQVVASQLALHVKKIKLYDTVRELSIVDGLTHVFVRRHFIERFEEEIKRSIRHGFKLAVLMLDIDHFKSYNDTHGHLVGDVTLREVAQVVLGGVRRVDIVGRYGGEEFGIVLPETDKKGGFEVAERIRSAVAKKKFRAYDEETKVTVSIGVAAFPEDVEGGAGDTYRSDLILELLKKADEALYQAKEEGRNRVVVSGRPPL